MVPLELQDRKAAKALQESPGPRDLLVLPVQLGPKEQLEPRVRKDQRALLDRPVLQVLRAIRAAQESREQLAPRDRLAASDQREQLALKGIKVLPE
jgi:hypothetical protein